jgi:hypothetical protein
MKKNIVILFTLLIIIFLSCSNRHQLTPQSLSRVNSIIFWAVNDYISHFDSIPFNHAFKVERISVGDSVVVLGSLEDNPKSVLDDQLCYFYFINGETIFSNINFSGQDCNTKDLHTILKKTFPAKYDRYIVNKEIQTPSEWEGKMLYLIFVNDTLKGKYVDLYIKPFLNKRFGIKSNN